MKACSAKHDGDFQGGEGGNLAHLRVEERCRVSDYMGIPLKSLGDVFVGSGEFCPPLGRDQSSFRSIQ
jgi:hypothetical protein